MIKKIFRSCVKMASAAWGLWIYFCVATLITQIVLFGVLWLKGGMSEEKRHKMLAVVQGIDLADIHFQEEQRLAQERLAAGDLSNQMVNNESLKRRDQIFIKGLGQVDTVKSRLLTSRQRFELVQGRFTRRLNIKETDAIEASRKMMTQTYQVMQPKQARDQIVLMLTDHQGKGMEDVVWIINAMSKERRRKVLDQFKDPETQQYLGPIMDNIRGAESTPEAAP